MEDTPLSEAIEAMIDRQTLATLLGAIMQVCHGKAEHLHSNWQDPLSARAWTRIAKRIEDLQMLARSENL